MLKEYDVIVVGAGHAGCEAAAAAANLGSSVLLITMNMQTIAQMSCNPAMGGIGKGQIIREIDALGGYSGIVSDKTAIQFRMLNKSKGAAMWSPRVQSDRMRFAEEWRLMLEATPNLDFWQDIVSALIIKNGAVEGVVTGMGIEIKSRAVILTNGTFLNGIIHIGEKQFGGGRSGEKSSLGITEQMNQLGFKSGRMKTGTPPRVDGRSLDYTVMEEQKGDVAPAKFSFSDETKPLDEQRSCHITYTNQEVHDILQTGFEKSPMYSGRIQGIGPRYCPSIEDKITRFADKDRHQIFVEPEGWRTIEIYVNGFSTSLPEEVQIKALKRIKGFQHAKLFRPGYAIEYDYFPPVQLYQTLQTKLVKRLFFAGQINGTTGYEEAACQGLMAGINAHLLVHTSEEFILKRSEAYIGVLIDDLVTKGTDEPYRMFTSRAEYRILLRQDNADVRLTPKGYHIGLVSRKRMNALNGKISEANSIIEHFKSQSVLPNEINAFLEGKNSVPIKSNQKLFNVLSRPGIDINSMIGSIPDLKEKFTTYLPEHITYAEILMKYEGYIKRENELALKLSRLDSLIIDSSFDYEPMTSLSYEAREKLSKLKPTTIGQAARISGISPADISILLVYLGR
ncbi:MAG: tRNA uridine-5-carboxymethylaminomethyl(34) synthesis enzyme MnmG [Bacteroidetes bacterium]|nr:tRNA uridine-5-carboxymethylaminomethyl(34) synthesis enzyme MnmG [Bacteroidota bacterium]